MTTTPRKQIIGGQIHHLDQTWKRGRKLSGRLGVIVMETKMTLQDIAYLNTADCHNITKIDYIVTQCNRETLSRVIQGKRNTPRYIKAIENAWHLPIATIRQIYREDKDREAIGEVPNIDEIIEFRVWYKSILREAA